MVNEVKDALKEVPETILSAAKLYFSPLAGWRDALNESYISNAEHKAIRLIGRAACDNQSDLIQYSFLAAERHKVIKEAVKKGERKKKLEPLIEELVTFLNDSFHKSALNNFRFLHHHFENRRGERPRICIKGNFKTAKKDTVITVFSDRVGRQESDFAIAENTGYEVIEKTGKYYLNNNIPKSTRSGYKNPRLNAEAVQLFIGQKIANEKQTVPSLWKECWIDYEKEEPYSFYKSILIIPMTLRNNQLSDEFKKKISMDDVDRAIFGYLCIDHPETDYFIEDLDIIIGYFFADALSLFLITRLIYTEISKTFREAESLVALQTIEQSISKEVEELYKKMQGDSY